ncbi:MAG: hypothetical protein ACI8RA_000163, partial [Chlamydiales bacterium]
MEALKTIVHDIWKEYSIKKDRNIPKLSCYYRKGSGKEGYYAERESGKITLEVETVQAAVSAAHQLGMASMSGHLAEYLGKRSPHFSLRPLWIACTYPVMISSRIFVRIPSWAHEALQESTLDNALDLFCSRLSQMGYNALVIGTWDRSPLAEIEPEELSIHPFFTGIRQRGFKVLLKPEVPCSGELESTSIKEFTHLGEAFEDLREYGENYDFIFWESHATKRDQNSEKFYREYTFSERISLEVKELEGRLPDDKGLVYFLHAANPVIAMEQAYSFEEISDDVGKKTILSFSVVAGEPYNDNLSYHPIWEQLRTVSDESYTPLLPIIDVGAVGNGQGLWPVLPLDTISACFSRMYRHHFAGAIAMASYLPAKGTFVDCALWVTGQMLWKPHCPYLLAKTWFLANRLSPSESWDEQALRNIRDISLRLKRFSNIRECTKQNSLVEESYRLEAEGLLNALNHLKVKYSCEEEQVNEE